MAKRGVNNFYLLHHANGQMYVNTIISEPTIKIISKCNVIAVYCMIEITNYKQVRSTNIQVKSEVRGSLPLLNPEPEGQGVCQWLISDD